VDGANVGTNLIDGHDAQHDGPHPLPIGANVGTNLIDGHRTPSLDGRASRVAPTSAPT